MQIPTGQRQFGPVITREGIHSLWWQKLLALDISVTALNHHFLHCLQRSCVNERRALCRVNRRYSSQARGNTNCCWVLHCSHTMQNNLSCYVQSRWSVVKTGDTSVTEVHSANCGKPAAPQFLLESRWFWRK